MKIQSEKIWRSTLLFVSALVFASSCNENIKTPSSQCSTVIQVNTSEFNWSCFGRVYKSHIEGIGKISRQELGSYEIGIQRQIHRVLTPEKRYCLWKNKFEALISERWTDLERAYLSKFNDALRISLFKQDEET